MPDNWQEYRIHVLKELERIGESTELIENKVEIIQKDLEVLKVYSSLWGAVGGFVISSIVTILVSLFA